MLRQCEASPRVCLLTSRGTRSFHTSLGFLHEQARPKPGRPRKDESNNNYVEAHKNDAATADTTAVPGTVDQTPTTARRRTTTAAINLPPRIIPASDKHHDLPSYLQYATTTSVDPTSNVYKGTRYEYLVASTLQTYNFTLSRTGRPDDKGIDLVGHWNLPTQTPTQPENLPIILQCKALKPRPSMIRELEGAYAGAPAGWSDEGVLALLVASGESTRGIVEALQRSRWPMGIMHVTDDGVLRQFLWNEAAATLRLGSLGVVVRYGGTEGERNSTGTSLALTWMGKVWRTGKTSDSSRKM